MSRQSHRRNREHNGRAEGRLGHFHLSDQWVIKIAVHQQASTEHTASKTGFPGRRLAARFGAPPIKARGRPTVAASLFVRSSSLRTFRFGQYASHTLTTVRSNPTPGT